MGREMGLCWDWAIRFCSFGLLSNGSLLAQILIHDRGPNYSPHFLLSFGSPTLAELFSPLGRMVKSDSSLLMLLRRLLSEREIDHAYWREGFLILGERLPPPPSFLFHMNPSILCRIIPPLFLSLPLDSFINSQQSSAKRKPAPLKTCCCKQRPRAG